MQLVILAGGRGARMGDLTRRLPKPMLPLAGKPLLEHQLELAIRYGCREVLMLTGCQGQAIEDYFGDGRRWGVRIEYHQEDQPLGTAGAVKRVEHRLRDDFLVFYGDIVMDVDLDALAAFHRRQRALVTLAVHPNNHPEDSDLVEVDNQGRVVALHPKPRDPARYYCNLVSAALYVMSPAVLRRIAPDEPADFARDVFPRLLSSGEPVAAYRTTEYIADAGTPARFQKAEADVLSGRVARMSRKNLRRAVFLDRDGVLNVEVGSLRTAEQLELLPGAAEAVRRLNESEHLVAVVSNQPAVAKGFTSEEELRRTHARLETLLGREHAYLDRICHCPHHPEKGFRGERPELKIACDCRKPAPGMILRVGQELHVDLGRSFLVGDQTADILAGERAGVKTVLVRTGYGGADGKHPCRPDFVLNDLAEAVELIVRRNPVSLL